MKIIEPKYLIIEQQPTLTIDVVTSEVTEEYARMLEGQCTITYMGYRRVNGILYYYYWLPAPSTQSI